MGDQLNDIYDQFLQEKDVFKKAQLLATLKVDKGVRVTEISKRLNMRSSYVSHILRLNKLPALIIDGYYSNVITPTHLYILARLQNHQQMVAAYEHVLSNNLSVFDTEILIRNVLYGIKSVGEYLSADEVRAFVVTMKQRGIAARIIQSRLRSKIILEIRGDLLFSSAKLREIMRLVERTSSTEEKADFL